MKPRLLEGQFEPETVDTIRKLQARFTALPLEGHPARYFAVEITRCLEAGLLLAALQVALSLLELVFRELLIEGEFEERSPEYAGHPDKLLREVREEIEDTRKLRLDRILERLSSRQLVGSSDADDILAFYEDVRIPFHHAIIGRLIKRFSPSAELGDLLPIPMSLREFDEAIELSALSHLDAAARFLDKYA